MVFVVVCKPARIFSIIYSCYFLSLGYFSTLLVKHTSMEQGKSILKFIIFLLFIPLLIKKSPVWHLIT